MTNIRTRGFESPAHLREHLAEIDIEPDHAAITEKLDNSDVLREIAWLRRDVTLLREQLAVKLDQPFAATAKEEHPWTRILLGVAATTILGAIAQRLRLGAPGAAAVPLLTAEFDRRIW